jgi:hypothetical protein
MNTVRKRDNGKSFEIGNLNIASVELGYIGYRLSFLLVESHD